ncbi:unnamed protein product [Macrosiphum euphorbiae]|uniref:Uncharacterized protein n=1 Tax=Macrosiphum euphorbiae TaxID=13131 RepID=A0AAV0XV23_9HEMI|nr:unnamed protein product [Macrosiphum euphorbiae]
MHTATSRLWLIVISLRSSPKRIVTPESIAGSPYRASIDCSWVCKSHAYGGSSYLPLPESILNRKAVVNPKNIDRQCLKCAILAKHVPHGNRTRVGTNYLSEEHRYDFSTISIPTTVSEIKQFERSNPDTTVNLYGVRKCVENKNNKKSSTKYAAYPLRIADEEKADHFDLLLISGKDDMNHYAFISNFSRLVHRKKIIINTAYFFVNYVSPVSRTAH